MKGSLLMKKGYTAAFKAHVALDLLKEEKTLAHISAAYGVHPNVLPEWRTQALKGLTTILRASGQKSRKLIPWHLSSRRS